MGIHFASFLFHISSIADKEAGVEDVTFAFYNSAQKKVFNGSLILFQKTFFCRSFTI